ncbi:MAG: LPS export ABC transporter periplasmic protein LptC [Paracoccaceae bacterium]
MRAQAGNQTIGGGGRRRVQTYSRAVAWMKVLLPLAAAAVISALYFAAHRTGDLTEIFTAEELATLGAGLRLDNPRFAGVTEQGEPFAIRAEWALPDSAMPRLIDLERPEGEIELRDGRIIAANAATGRMHRGSKILILKGAVVLDTSDGYHMESDLVELDLDAKTAHSPGPVSGTGPNGRIDAGSMRAAAGEDGTGAGKIWFENRVRVVFIPAKGPATGPVNGPAAGNE